MVVQRQYRIFQLPAMLHHGSIIYSREEIFCCAAVFATGCSFPLQAACEGFNSKLFTRSGTMRSARRSSIYLIRPPLRGEILLAGSNNFGNLLSASSVRQSRGRTIIPSPASFTASIKSYLNGLRSRGYLALFVDNFL